VFRASDIRRAHYYRSRKRPGIGDIPQRDAGLPHQVADCRRIEIADFTEDQIGLLH
jgi:hypothetical protein